MRDAATLFPYLPHRGILPPFRVEPQAPDGPHRLLPFPIACSSCN